MKKVKKFIFVNAFSLGMLGNVKEATINVKEVSANDIIEILKKLDVDYPDIEYKVYSAIGHTSTAQVLSEILDFYIAPERIQITLDKDTTLIVFQLLTRLEEGKVLSKEEILSLPYKFYTVNLI